MYRITHLLEQSKDTFREFPRTNIYENFVGKKKTDKVDIPISWIYTIFSLNYSLLLEPQFKTCSGEESSEQIIV